jgi:hypothetical protein
LFGNETTLLESPLIESEPLPVESLPDVGDGPKCHHCGSGGLSDCEDPPGIRCDACGMLVWLDDGQSLRRVGWHDHDWAAIDPNDVPTCETCGRLCDTLTVDDAWLCSRCDSVATIGRRKIERLMQQAKSIRCYDGRRNG